MMLSDYQCKLSITKKIVSIINENEVWTIIKTFIKHIKKLLTFHGFIQKSLFTLNVKDNYICFILKYQYNDVIQNIDDFIAAINMKYKVFFFYVFIHHLTLLLTLFKYADNDEGVMKQYSLFESVIESVMFYLFFIYKIVLLITKMKALIILRIKWTIFADFVMYKLMWF
jgi:hypothetical protein